MVKKFTFLEVHLDDARFTKTTGDATDVDEREMDDVEMEGTDADESASGPSLRQLLGMALAGVAVAFGVRRLVRKLLGDEMMAGDEMDESMDASDQPPVEVDIDDAVDA